MGCRTEPGSVCIAIKESLALLDKIYSQTHIGAFLWGCLLFEKYLPSQKHLVVVFTAKKILAKKSQENTIFGR